VAPRIDFSVLRRELKLPGDFPAEAMAEAEAAARQTSMPGADRLDVAFVTIDPATSLDLDQAMHLSRRDGGGFRVQYAIADVASFVRPGGPLEAETWTRGQTIYLPDGRIPLHPAVLSEGSVSLFPEVERAAVVWTIDLDSDGEIVDVALERARVRSRAKLDYVGVQAMADAGELPEPIALLPELGKLLAARAADRGAVNLPLPEQEIEPDGDGWRLVLRAPVAMEEHNAQISLLTGMAAASLMLRGGVGLLRTMPAARPEAVEKLRAAAESLGVAWPSGASVGSVVASVDPAAPRGAAFLDQAAELLRGAAYTAFDGSTPEETGHGGVGAPYAHVTAPLRRLADRYATETCLALFSGGEVPAWAREALHRLPKAMADSDRMAGGAARSAIDLTEAVLLQHRVGETFDAGVVDIDAASHHRPPGGTVAVDSPAVRARCVGSLPLGERISVRLDTADPVARKVLFSYGDVLRDAVNFVVAALGGQVPADEVAARLAPRLAGRGEVAGYQRYAAFRNSTPVVEDVRARGEWAARAIVVTGDERWELDVAVSPSPPHQILSFQPRPAGGDAVTWESIRGRLPRDDRPGPISSRLAAVVEEQKLVGLVAGIAVGGEVIYRGCFGVADLSSGVPVTASSVFRVGSVTKMVTALAVLKLAAAGSVDLSAPLGSDAGIESSFGRRPTVGELLVHRGGLPKDMRPPFRLAWEPGSRAEYSNVGYGLLGRVVAQASGMSFAEYCASDVLGAYGLRHTTVQERGVAAPADVTGYRVAEGRVAPAPPAVAPFPGAGGMTSDLDDLLTLTALFSRGEDPLVRAAFALTAEAGPGVRFAPGFAILEGVPGPGNSGGTPGRRGLLWRGGAADGFTAEVVAALDGSCDVVLLASKSPPEGLREVARGLVEAAGDGWRAAG
jgi:CubicO group peptidase (beta-lactamase class C family)